MGRSTAAPVVVAVLPMLAVLVHAVSQIHRAPLYGGDYALLEMGARSALRGVQRVGPYSRFGWDHPGPATFYWSAPFYALSGQRPEGLGVAALVSNIAAVAAIVVVARRAAGVVGAWTAVAAALFLYHAGGATWLDQPWNPLTVILPVAAVAVLGAGAVAGLRWTVPLIAVAASVAVQTHVGTVPAVALLLVTLGPLALWRWRRDRVAWRRPVLAGVLVLAVMWALPVLQQVTGHPGNLSEIADFFTTRGGAHHSLSDALRVTGPQFTLNRGRLFSSLSRAAPTSALPATISAKVIFLIAGAAVGLLVNVFRRRWFCAGLCVAGLAGTAGAVLGAQRIVGPVFGYLTSSALSMGLVLWLAVGATVTAELARIRRDRAEPARYAIAVVVVVALVGASLLLARIDAGSNLFANKRPNATAVRLVRTVRALTHPGPGQAVFLEPQTGTKTWSLAAMVANQLERDGITVHTPHAWEFLFGSQRTAGDADATHIRFVDVRLRRIPARPARKLGQIGFTQVYLLHDLSGDDSARGLAVNP